MQVTRFSDINAFCQRAEPFLVRHEAEHNLPLGICATLRRQPDHCAIPPYLALVEEGGEVAAVVLRTPPYNLVLSQVEPAEATAAALALIAEDAHAVYGGALPGVIGPAALSRAFAEHWQALTGQPVRPGMRERAYQLDAVIPVTSVPGTFRRATAADRDVLVRWIAAFFDEALPVERADAGEWVDRALASPSRGLYLWEDGGEPVSLAGQGAETPNGARVGPVYTPPERRGRGYASACTAALSQLLLDGGRRFCFLFTDLNNPTSNHIYQTIGYRPVCDVDEYRFGATPE